MTEPLTSSEVVARAMRLTPDGVESKESGRCALCGKVINEGDLCSPLLLTKAFMDDIYMAARGSNMICGYCPELKTKVGLQKTGFGAFSIKDGALPFRKWKDIGDTLLNPPEPPFVLTYATVNNQHMAWRAPVNLSKDLFYVRVGLRDLKIRRKFLIEAVEHCRILGEAIAVLPKGKKAPKSDYVKKTRMNPFAGLTPDMKGPVHGIIKTAALQPDMQHLNHHVEALRNLTTGELWGLRFVLSLEVEIEQTI